MKITFSNLSWLMSPGPNVVVICELIESNISLKLIFSDLDANNTFELRHVQVMTTEMLWCTQFLCELAIIFQVGAKRNSMKFAFLVFCSVCEIKHVPDVSRLVLKTYIHDITCILVILLVNISGSVYEAVWSYSTDTVINSTGLILELGPISLTIFSSQFKCDGNFI